MSILHGATAARNRVVGVASGKSVMLGRGCGVESSRFLAFCCARFDRYLTKFGLSPSLCAMMLHLIPISETRATMVWSSSSVHSRRRSMAVGGPSLRAWRYGVALDLSNLRTSSHRLTNDWQRESITVRLRGKPPSVLRQGLWRSSPGRGALSSSKCLIALLWV